MGHLVCMPVAELSWRTLKSPGRGNQLGRWRWWWLDRCHSLAPFSMVQISLRNGPRRRRWRTGHKLAYPRNHLCRSCRSSPLPLSGYRLQLHLHPPSALPPPLGHPPVRLRYLPRRAYCHHSVHRRFPRRRWCLHRPSRRRTPVDVHRTWVWAWAWKNW